MALKTRLYNLVTNAQGQLGNVEGPIVAFIPFQAPVILLDALKASANLPAPTNSYIPANL